MASASSWIIGSELFSPAAVSVCGSESLVAPVVPAFTVPG